MADETIGGISIPITGDESDLKEALSRAIDGASQAGQSIADSLTKAYEGSAGGLQQSLDQIAGSADGLRNAAQPMADAVSQAVDQLARLDEGSQAASTSADSLNDAVGGLAASLASVGDSGVADAAGKIVEGFDSIGESATTTADTITGVMPEALQTALAPPDLGPITQAFSSLDEEIAALVGQGMSLKEALDASSFANVQAGATGASSAIGDLGAAEEQAGANAATAASQLSLFDQSASVPWADAAGQLNMFATELEPVGENAAAAAAAVTTAGQATTGAGDAASQSAPKVHEFGEETQHAGEHAHEAGGKLGEMSESLIALGEAFIITEGLREFGEEAMHASDNVTKASIALTALTGSADAAKETIEKLEKLGVDEGLSMPSLLSASTRMTNFLGSAELVPELLAKLGDSAVVTGKDIGAAADAFDRIISTGNVGAKPLQALGLTMAEVGAQMGDASLKGKALKEAFGELTKDQQIEVLSNSLDRLHGTAKKVAEETFSGQFTVLANQWEGVMKEVGDALLPIITNLNEFLKVDVLPFLKELVDDFNALSPPVKDTVVALALAAAAIIPVTAAVGAFGIALSGLAEVGALATTALEGVGLAAVPLAPILAAVAGIGLALYFSGVADSAIALAEDIGNNFGSIAEIFTPLVDVLRDIAKVAFPEVQAALDSLAGDDAWDNLKTWATDWKNRFKDLIDYTIPGLATLKTGLDILDAAIQVIGGHWKEMDKAGTDLAHNALTQQAHSAADAAGAFDKHKESTIQLGEATANLKEKLDKFKPLLQAMPDDIKVLSDRYKDWQKAHESTLEAIAKSGLTIDEFWIKKLDAANESMRKFSDLEEPIVTNTARVEVGVGKANSVMEKLGLMGPALDPLQQAFKDLGLEIDGTKDDADDALDAFTLIANDPHSKLPGVKAAWEEVSAAVAKLAKTDLPAAISAEDDYRQALIRTGAIQEEIDAATIKELHDEITLAHQRGESANAAGIELTNLHQRQKDVADSTDLISKSWAAVVKTWNDAFDQIGKTLADQLVTIDKTDSAWTKMLKNLEKEILEQLIGIAFKALRAEMDHLITNLFPSLTDAISKLGSKGLGDLSSAAMSAGERLGNMAAGADQMAEAGTKAVGTATTGISGVAGAASSATTALTGWISAIGSAVGALASIGSFVTSLETNHKLAVIEENTRKTEILLDQIGHGIWTGTDLMTGYLNNIMTHAWVLPDISAHTLAAQQLLEQLVNNGIEITGAIGTVSQAIQQTKTATEGAAASSAAAAAAAAATAAGTQATANAVEASGRVSANATMTAALRTIDELQALKGTLLTQSDAALAAGDLQSAALLRGQADQIDQQIKAIKDSSIFQVSHTIEALQAVQSALVGAQNDAILHGDAAAAAVIQGQLDSIGGQISELEKINEKLGVYGQATNDNLTTSNSSLERIHGAIQSSAAASSAAITGGLNDALSATNAAIITLEAREMALLAAEQTAMDRGDLNAAAIIQNEINNTAQQIDTLKAQLPDITAAIHQQSGVIQQEGVSSRGAVQTNTGVLNGLHDALNAAKDAIVTLEAREMTLIAAEQTAIDRGDLNAAAVIRAEINNTAQQIDALKAQVPNITDAIAHQSGVIQQEGVLSRGAIAKSQDDVKTALQLEHDVLIKMSQDQTDIGNATQAAIFKAQADAVQKQIDAIGTSATKIESAIGRDEQSGKTNADKITTAIQISGAGSLTALFGMRDTLIAGLTAARDQIVALQRSLIAAGEISTAATLDVQINGLNAQITALKTSTAAVTAATAGGAAAITGVIGTAADGIKDTFSSGTGNVVDTLTVGFKAITDSQVAGAQQVAAAVVASTKMGMNPVTGGFPAGTFPGETYGATGNPIAPGFYFNSGSIAQRQAESQLAQAALYAGDWNAWQYALSTFAAASGGAIPAWAETNPGTGVAYTPEDLAANAAAHHTGGSVTGLHSFDTGGLIPYDQVAQVHAGEVILTAQATQDLARYSQQSAQIQLEIAQVNNKIAVDIASGNNEALAQDRAQLAVLKEQLASAETARIAAAANLAALQIQEDELKKQTLLAQQQLTATLAIIPAIQLPAGFQGGGMPPIMNPPAGGSQQVPGAPPIMNPPAGGSQHVPGLPPIMNPPAGGSPGNGPVPLASAITNLENYLESQLTTEELRKLRAQIGNESLIDYYRHNLTQAEWANIQRFVGTPGLFPSFATGIDYVPYDMTARIHEGERVLNRGEAQAYGTGPQNINITVNGANVPNPRELARMIGDHVKSVTSNNQVRR